MEAAIIYRIEHCTLQFSHEILQIPTFKVQRQPYNSTLFTLFFSCSVFCMHWFPIVCSISNIFLLQCISFVPVSYCRLFSQVSYQSVSHYHWFPIALCFVFALVSYCICCISSNGYCETFLLHCVPYALVSYCSNLHWFPGAVCSIGTGFLDQSTILYHQCTVFHCSVVH